jgi:hypothetical protein
MSFTTASNRACTIDSASTIAAPPPRSLSHQNFIITVPPTLHGPCLSDVGGGPGRNTAQVARIEERRKLNWDFLRGVAAPQRNLNKYGLFDRTRNRLLQINGTIFLADGTHVNCLSSGSTELRFRAGGRMKFPAGASCRRWSERWARWNRGRFAEPDLPRRRRVRRGTRDATETAAGNAPPPGHQQSSDSLAEPAQARAPAMPLGPERQPNAHPHTRARRALIAPQLGRWSHST